MLAVRLLRSFALPGTAQNIVFIDDIVCIVLIPVQSYNETEKPAPVAAAVLTANST